MVTGPGPPGWLALAASLSLLVPSHYACANPVMLPSDTCDQTIWDNTLQPKHVHETIATCSEGHVTWERPYGAIRVTFLLTFNPKHAIEACFKAKSFSTVAKISLEENEDTVLSHNLGQGQRSKYSNDNLRALVTLNETVPKMRRELCVTSQNGVVTLYIEALSDVDAMLSGRVQLDYDVTRVHSKSSTDDMEECRPCTDEELVQSVCSSDFVAIGEMTTVLHYPEDEETEIRIRTHRVIRQRHPVFHSNSLQFAQSKDNFPGDLQAGSSIGSSVGSSTVMSQGKDYFEGGIRAPRKCRIRHGNGEFIFTGRIRLGIAFLQCAPRLQDFAEIWSKGSRNGLNPCVIEGL